ncbi:MAG TPA: alpha/beta fold hydrolase [Acetobacteraceae bacterium]
MRATLRELAAFITRLPARLRAAAGEPAAPSNTSCGAVLVLPTLLHSDRQTRALRAAIARQGYAVFGWGLGRDWGPTPRLMGGAEARLLEISNAYGPVSLVGLSMGGLFCRWLAAAYPARVRQVITVCSPFRAPFDSFFLPLRPLLRLWPVRNLTAQAAALERRLPVPETNLYSPRDGIVAWQSCYDPARPQDAAAIDSLHVLIATDPAVQAVVLERLEAPVSASPR